MITLFEDISGVPDYDPVNHIWEKVDSDEVKSICILQIFSELEQDTANMNDAQCRSVLSRIQGYYNTIMIKARIEASKSASTDEHIIQSQEF